MEHPDWPAFLNAIVAEPDEDTPRLVAADFLEENGEPDRAAFIRMQIEFARLNASGLSDSRAADELHRKLQTYLSLKSLRRHLWSAEECPELVRMLTGRPGSPPTSVNVEGADRLTWHRGFVTEVHCPAGEWLRHGVAVRKRNPVEQVILSGCETTTRADWYAGLDALRGLNRVELDFFAGIEEFNDFCQWLRGWLPGTQVLQAVPF